MCRNQCLHDLEDMRGQGYNNVANMKGLQKKIQEINLCTFYVPCAAHSLNFVVNDAAKYSLEITNFTGNNKILLFKKFMCFFGINFALVNTYE